jgi:hypothetical protein
VFWDVWARAVNENMSAERIPSVPAYMIPVVTHEPISTGQ